MDEIHIGMATKSEVEMFLKELHEKMRVGRIWFVSRQKNLDAIADLDIEHPNEERKRVIKDLVAEDYSEGPVPDDFGVAPLWVFGKDFKGREIYIKIQIIGLDTVCISFHEAEHHPMDYPLKGKGL